MKLSILVGFLAVCLMAFAANVNSERVKYYHDGLELKGTEAPEDVTETTDAPETTEPAESTDAPDSHVTDQLTIEEAHRFIDHLMATVAQIVNSLLDALHSGKPHPHFPQPGYPHEGLPNHHESEEGNHVPEHPNEHEGPKEDNHLPGHPNDKHENPENNHPEHHEDPKDDKPEHHEEPEENKPHPEHHEKPEEDKDHPEHHEKPEEYKPHPEHHEKPEEDKDHPEHHEEPEENKPHPEHHEEPKEDKEQPEHHEESKENNHLPENHEESKEDSRNPEHHEEPEKDNHPSQQQPKENEPNVHGPNEQLSIEPRTIFSPFWWLVKSVMKTLRGINCSIKGVVNVRHNTEEMLHNFQRCEAGTVKQVQAVVDSAYKVLAISAEIIHINDEDCGNPNYMADNVDPKAKASASCAKKLRSKIISLNSQIKTTVKLIKKVPQDAGVCVHNTFGKYRDSIADFPGFVKECSKFK